MSELTTEERLAALQARRSRPQPVRAVDNRHPAPIGRQPSTPSGRPRPAPGDDRSPVVQPSTILMPAAEEWVVEPHQVGSTTAPTDRLVRRLVPDLGLRSRTIPWERITAAGASVLSFASMIVAMGPLLESAEAVAVETTGDSADPVLSTPAAGELSPTPTAPPVAIEVAPDPNPDAAATAPGGAQAMTVQAEGEQVQPAADSAQGATVTSVATAASATAETAGVEAKATPVESTAAVPKATGAPTTASPTTKAPTTAAQPASTTAAPTTPAPTTAPPTTAPPTTAVPTTASTTTAPPRSEGSG